MKYALLFLVIVAIVYLPLDVLTKRQRKRGWSFIRALILPAIVASVVVCALIFFNLNFNGKVI